MVTYSFHLYSRSSHHFIQYFKQNLTDAYKRELPVLTFYSTEQPVHADKKQTKTVCGIFDISFQNKLKAI